MAAASGAEPWDQAETHDLRCAPLSLSFYLSLSTDYGGIQIWCVVAHRVAVGVVGVGQGVTVATEVA